jgi:3-hydroxyacyl-CoA dehydrogenase
MELMASPVSRHLVSLFLAGEDVKRRAASVPDAVTRVGVLGAGLMGSQIAGQLAEKGYAVVLRDVAPSILAGAMGRILKAQTSQVRKKSILPSELRYRLLRIAPTTTIKDVSPAPLVIEAVSEKLDVKRSVLAEFESEAGPDAIFATNTSSYTLTDIALKAVHPQRCVGLHFFNPVAKMQLVEVVRAPFTSAQALAQACGIAKTWISCQQDPVTISGGGCHLGRGGRPDPAHRYHSQGLRHGSRQRTPHGAAGAH